MIFIGPSKMSGWSPTFPTLRNWQQWWEKKGWFCAQSRQKYPPPFVQAELCAHAHTPTTHASGAVCTCLLDHCLRSPVPNGLQPGTRPGEAGDPCSR